MASYGLQWQGKEKCKEQTLQPASSLKKIKFQQRNLLINADNLEALQAMREEYHSKIDVIYIDPPYNTKNYKFIYKDTFTSHSTWLNFIYPRLLLACGMLKEDGVIFISIDDNEVAQLKLLCDEIFGEKNFISQFVWQKKKSASFLHKKIAKLTEYILCYAKERDKAPMLSVEKSSEFKPYPLNFQKNPLSELCFAEGSICFSAKFEAGVIQASDMSHKNVALHLLDDVEIKNGVNANAFRMSGHWRYSQSSLDRLIKEGAILSVAKLPFRINYMKQETKPKLMRNMLTKESYNMATYEDATSQIIELFGYEAFLQPKPVALIKTLVQSVTYAKKDALVLDFFAGSGTTAEAVMKLNLEDRGDRSYILIQSNEEIKRGSPAFLNGYRTIYDIMRERVKLSHKKYRNGSFKELKIVTSG